MSMLSLPVEKIDELAVPYASPLAPAARPLTLPLREPLAVAIAKRTIDVVLSVLGLALTLALFPVLVLAIYLDSPGPVFYRQRRARFLRRSDVCGRCDFVTFEMLKFRTMRTDAEQFTGAVLAAENDPRITRVGRF